jgi:hypothetical protein
MFKDVLRNNLPLKWNALNIFALAHFGFASNTPFQHTIGALLIFSRSGKIIKSLWDIKGGW